MSGTDVMRSGRLRLGVIALALLGALVSAAPASAANPPAVWGQWARPHTFGGSGGTATIYAQTDGGKTYDVYAIVTYPNNSEKEVPLKWHEGESHGRSEAFEASVKLPANPSYTPRTYSVEVFAENAIGQTTSASAGTIIVEPNGTPSPGWLTLQPNYWKWNYERAVKVGTEGFADLVLENNSNPARGAVSGFVHLVTLEGHPDISLLGAGPEGDLSFTLKPGAQQTLTVGFRPTEKGELARARLLFVRSDGNQPNMRAELYGWSY